MLRWCLPLILMVVVGCGDGKIKLPTASVAGTVTYQGKPLSGGRIIFMHQQSGQAVAADIVAGGRFKLVAFQGKNHVAVGCYAPGSADHSPRGLPGRSLGKSLIPDRYAEPATSDLTLEVKPGENDKADFTLVD